MYAPLQKKEDKKSSTVQKKQTDNKQMQKTPIQIQNSFNSPYNTNPLTFNSGKPMQFQSSAFNYGKPIEYSPFFSKPLQNQENKTVENEGIENNTLQLKSDIEITQAESQSKSNNTGIPTPLKNQFEAVSGFSFDDVKVHYNSDKPVQLQALAYTQGNQVYIGHGQEKHLKHELGHVVQQKQGIVRPTTFFKGIPVNKNTCLENQADSIARNISIDPISKSSISFPVVQKINMGEQKYINRLKAAIPNNSGAYVKTKNLKEFFIDFISEKQVSDWGHLHVFHDGEKITKIQAAHNDCGTKVHTKLTLTEGKRGQGKTIQVLDLGDFLKDKEISLCVKAFNLASELLCFDRDLSSEDDE